ncbi:MAG: uracil-DNA glycosylase [Robiginitomaculum sp.]
MNDTQTISADALRSALEWWEESGVDIAPIPASKPAKKPRKALNIPAEKAAVMAVKPAPEMAPKTTPKITSDEATQKLLAESAAIAGAAPTLEALKAAIESFDAGDLSANASRAVFARGNPKADLMIIGEAPGANEDKAGQPFMGQTGAMLTAMLAAIGIGEDDVYITNVCNYRPLNGRAPSPPEIALCTPFIARHIALKAPKIIVMTGGVSLETLTGQKGITKLRGQWQSYAIEGGEPIPALPLYHPAFLLRRPELKGDAWRDLLALKARIASL